MNLSENFSIFTHRDRRVFGIVCHYQCLLAYLKDSNAAAHSVDSDMFQSSDSSICALQDLTHCQVVYASTSWVMTHRWRVVTRDRGKKSGYNWIMIHINLSFTRSRKSTDVSSTERLYTGYRVRIHCDVWICINLLIPRRAGSGRKTERAGEPVSIVLKTSFRPLLKKETVYCVKMSSVKISVCSV